jgi:hypothetical protein
MPNLELLNDKEAEISDQLSCMEQGVCGELRQLDPETALVDLTSQLDLAEIVEDSKTGDLMLKNMRILSPGVRNNFIYSKEAVKTTRHLKGLKSLDAAPSPFVVPHSSNPAEQIGRIENLRWSDEHESLIGDGRVYSDDDLPLSKTAIALMKRELETGTFLSVSTRLRVEPFFDNAEGKASVKNLRLIHVAWVDVGADPSAGISMVQNEEIIDNPYPSEHACRLREPGDFQPNSFRRTERDQEGKKYSIIMGKLKDETTMTEQAYRYPIDAWDAEAAKTHCDSHKGKTFEKAKETQSSEDDTTQRADSHEAIEKQIVQNLKNKERGLTMSEDVEAPNTEEQTNEEEQQTVVQNVVVQKEEEPTPTVDNAEEILTIKRTELDVLLADFKAEVHKEFELEQARKLLIGSIVTVDESIPMDFLQSLTDVQLTTLEKVVENFVGYLKEREDVITELRSKAPLLTLDNEKPSYAGNGATSEFMKKVENYYPSKSVHPLQKRGEQK